MEKSPGVQGKSGQDTGNDFLALRLSSTPRCGSGPKCRLEAPPPPPPCALGPLPPLPEPCKKSQGGGGKRKRRGRGGKGFGLREGSSNYNGGWGGPSKHQLGPDPHLGAPKVRGGSVPSKFAQCRCSLVMLPLHWSPRRGNSCKKPRKHAESAV